MVWVRRVAIARCAVLVEAGLSLVGEPRAVLPSMAGELAPAGSCSRSARSPGQMRMIRLRMVAPLGASRALNPVVTRALSRTIGRLDRADVGKLTASKLRCER